MFAGLLARSELDGPDLEILEEERLSKLESARTEKHKGSSPLASDLKRVALE